MRDNSKDSALERNLIRDWHHKCQEYEQVKAGKHPNFGLWRTSTSITTPIDRCS